MAAQWVQETVERVIKSGDTKMHLGQEKIYGLIDTTNAREGKHELSFIDWWNVLTFRKQDVYDQRFHAYLGQRHLKLRECHYYRCTGLVIYDRKSNSYVYSEIDNDRIMKRFREKMCKGLKAQVFMELYKYWYMQDINFEEALNWSTR